MTILQLLATITNGIVAVLCVMILLRQKKIMKMYKYRKRKEDEYENK